MGGFQHRYADLSRRNVHTEAVPVSALKPWRSEERAEVSAGFSLILTKIGHKVQFLWLVLSRSGKPVAGGLFPAPRWVFFLS